MASNGPQTFTFTETVNGGASGTLTPGDWIVDMPSNTTSSEHPELFTVTSTGTLAATAYAQTTGQKCLLQIDIVENDADLNTGIATAGLADPKDMLLEIPELVRRAAASAANEGTNSSTDVAPAFIKSVYVRIEYVAEATKKT